jgi:hypothetical protein
MPREREYGIVRAEKQHYSLLYGTWAEHEEKNA